MLKYNLGDLVKFKPGGIFTPKTGVIIKTQLTEYNGAKTGTSYPYYVKTVNQNGNTAGAAAYNVYEKEIIEVVETIKAFAYRNKKSTELCWLGYDNSTDSSLVRAPEFDMEKLGSH
jgi:hypothetical protein